MNLDVQDGQEHVLRSQGEPWARCSREVLGVDFAGTIVCDGWTAYPAFSSNLQRCWAHIFRKAEDVDADYDVAEPVYRSLKQMYVGLQPSPETDPTARERAQMQKVAQTGLKPVVEPSVPDGPVAPLLGKIEGGIDHWLTFVVEPAVPPTNNAAKNALREPVVLRKIIGTLRNDRGMFVHETVLSLLATWRQQGCNPYEGLKQVVRDSEMISRTQAIRLLSPRVKHVHSPFLIQSSEISSSISVPSLGFSS